MNSSTKKITSLFAIIVLIVLTLFAFICVEIFSLRVKSDFSKPIVITIPQGSKINTITEKLTEAGLIDRPRVFKIIARIFGMDRKLRAGRWTFNKPLSLYGLLKSLTAGGSFDIMVTIPEGKTVFEIAQILSDSLGVDVDSFLFLCFDRSFLDSLGIGAPSCEGYLFPETYSFPRNIRHKDIIIRMFAQFKSIWVDSMVFRARELGMTGNQVLTLASIIEGEARVKWEQRVISSVYHNRLRLGMLLQADPTTIYGLRSFNRPLTREDIDTSNSPYNTYKYPGLPPGPINNPGLRAIYSALWPDSSDYLYFVSNRDGTHWFNKTLEGHYSAIHAIRELGQRGPMPEVYNRNILISN